LRIVVLGVEVACPSQLQQAPVPPKSFRQLNFPAVMAHNDCHFGVTRNPVISSYEVPSHPPRILQFSSTQFNSVLHMLRILHYATQNLLSVNVFKTLSE